MNDVHIFISHDYIRLLLAVCTTLLHTNTHATCKLQFGVRLAKFPTVQTALRTGGSLDLQKTVQSVIGSLTVLHEAREGNQ